MPKPVKKIKTTYEAFVWDGDNAKELEEWDMYDTYVTGGFGGNQICINYYEPETGDYVEVWLAVGDVLLKPSRGKIKHLRKHEYEDKFEDA
jgi:hypothetical protein